ncbi:hypothetical protein JAAARDRAFT_122934 [Jaapia argillacea MUCL 33604]|uniref:RING-type domain-containing protein n=1 Tax=Jaapia argillacea MUCL 33604 TaxID=933084 RepID=A0A067Q3B9_9AGAM|nr:hypothetical protein JAAARDRAFT_122934 [Jaapia argillacea MUCL 33604]
MVTFSAGASIQRIVTAFESRRLIVSGFPVETSPADLITLMEQFGPLHKINRDESAVTPTARADFMEPCHASLAVERLDGMEYRRKELAVRLDLSIVESGAATLLSRKVKVSWFAPSIVAWAHYPSIALAKKKATELDGKAFKGCHVRTAFQTPSARQTRSFSVEIKGLPIDTDASNLRRFFATSSVTIGEPSFDRFISTQDVRELLLSCGPLELFDVLPEDRTKRKITGFAQFCTPEAAAEAVKKLHNVPQLRLHRTPLWLELVHSVKYLIPHPQFLTLKSDLDRLRDTHSQCKLRYYERDEAGQTVDPVCIRIHGTDPKTLGRAKVEVERLIRGETLKSEGKEIWDDYLGTDKGKAFLEYLHQTYLCFVKCDHRTRMVHLYGTLTIKTVVTRAILTKLEEVATQRHTVSLDKGALRVLLTGGLKLLQEAIASADGLILDIVASTLTIRGEEEDVRLVRRLLGEMQTNRPRPLPTAETLCPVCFCEATNPISLKCGHIYCTMCLQHLLRSSSGAIPLKCVEEIGTVDGTTKPCASSISLEVLRDLLSPAEEARLYNSRFQSHINGLPKDFHYCPTPDCQVIYRTGKAGTVLRCPRCLVRICSSCHVEFHEGLACGEAQYDAAEDLKAYQQWRLENGVKPCPNCNVDLQKNGGCNHIKCIRCETHMCWVCMATFKDTDTSGGVYAHMRRAHGDIF